ncbi:TPA: hypothetical protein ACH3X3_000574 [Trebouxia sp. C0006]
MQGQELLKFRSSAHVRKAWYPFQITASLGHMSQAVKQRKPMSNNASLIESLKQFAHYGAEVQEQRHGSLAATNVPPTPETSTLGPRVEHLSAAADGPLKSTISNQLKLPEWFVHELLCFGAVHWCPVPPALSPMRAASMDSEHVAHLSARRQAAVSIHGKQAEQCQPKRVTQDIAINKHAFIRVHVHPKRFPAVYTVDWQECVIYRGADYVVVHKPAGVQVAPTVDNLLENVLFCTAQALQCAESLLITHRLDACTEGLLVVGRNRPFVQHFNRLLQQPGAVRKFYKALTQHPPPTGKLTHHKTQEQVKGQPAHSQVHDSPVPGSQCCLLEVLDVSPVQVVHAVAAEWGPVAYEALLELHTGRTHQIRVQLGAEGFPLYGDTMYANMAHSMSPKVGKPQQHVKTTVKVCDV